MEVYKIGIKVHKLGRDRTGNETNFHLALRPVKFDPNFMSVMELCYQATNNHYCIGVPMKQYDQWLAGTSVGKPVDEKACVDDGSDNSEHEGNVLDDDPALPLVDPNAIGIKDDEDLAVDISDDAEDFADSETVAVTFVEDVFPAPTTGVARGLAILKYACEFLG